MSDELAIAFAMRCDQEGLSYEEGLMLAQSVTAEIESAAEDRASYAPREGAEVDG